MVTANTNSTRSKLRLRASISLDGYTAGPQQSKNNPLGLGGMRLHQWAFELAAMRAMLGLGDGGIINDSTPIIEQHFANVGASIMGRNMFGPVRGDWDTDTPWDGWWGDNPPFHHPVFVLTQHARAPLNMEGGTTFYFVTDGIESALHQARQAAAGKDISIAGGAQTAQQFLRAGLVDEMTLSLVPVLLGSGERLFVNQGDDLHGLKLVQTIATPEVVHLKFAKP